MIRSRIRSNIRADLGCLLLCFFVAFGLRLWFQASFRDQAGVDLRFVADLDNRTFHLWGMTIANGDLLSQTIVPPTEHWWATRIADRGQWQEWLPGEVFHQSPLYAYLIALAYLILGSAQAVIPTLQAILGGFSAVGCWWVGKVRGSSGTGLAAGLLYATCAPSVFYSQFLLRASLLESISILFVLLLLRVQSSDKKRDAFLAGLGGGLAILAKPIFICLLPLALYPRRSKDTQSGGFGSISRLPAFALGLVIALAPLIARNLWVGASPFAVSTRGPAAFIAGNAEASDGMEWFPERTRTALLDGQARDILHDTGWALYPVAIETLRTHSHQPWGYGILVLRKLQAIFRADELPNNVDFSSTRVLVPFLRWLPDFRLVGFLGLLGMISGPVHWRDRGLLISVVIALCLFTCAFFVVGRFRAPILPVLSVLGGMALTDLRRAILPIGTRKVRMILVLWAVGVSSAAWMVWPRSGDPSWAKARFDLALRIKEEGRSMHARGDSSSARQKLSQSFTMYQEVSEAPMDPEEPRLRPLSYSHMAQIHTEFLGNLDLAQELFVKVLGELGVSDDLESLWLRANVRASLGNICRSRLDVDRIRSAEWKTCYQDYQKANELLRQLVHRGRDDMEVRSLAAWVECLLAHLLLYQPADREEAERHYLNSLQILPGYSGATYGLGCLWIEQSRNQPWNNEVKAVLIKARSYLEGALNAELPPDRPEIIRVLIEEVERRLAIE